MPISGFCHSELLSGLWVKRGLVPNTLTAGNTIDTYTASPQPAAGIDSWNSGAVLFKNLLVVVDVASVSSTGGTLVITLRDSGSAITTGNGDSTTSLVATLATISAAGLYVAEFQLDHVFASTLTRVGADANNDSIRRYHSLRAVAGTRDFTFGALMVYGGNLRDFPVQSASSLTITYAST